jgi:predicted GNAT family N-acyltransferase
LFESNFLSRGKEMNPRIVVASEPSELIDHFQLRRTIFIEEQGVDERLEMDGLDDAATLIVLYLDAQPIGCARYRVLDTAVKVERVGVLKEHRNQGLGEQLMVFIEEQILEYTDKTWMTLNAQLAAKNFYLRLGYVPIGELFEEANITHQKMMKEINRLDAIDIQQ